MEKNFLEIYNNYKFRADNYTPSINKDSYIKNTSLWLDFINNNSQVKNSGGYYILEIINDCARRLKYLYASVGGVLYNDSWIAFEDCKYNSDYPRYFISSVFNFQGPFLGLAIIRILEEHFNTSFFDIPLVAGTDTNFKDIIEPAVIRLIKSQNYFGFYMKNRLYRDRQRKINIREFRVVDVKVELTSYYPGTIRVWFEDIKTGKRHVAEEWNVCLSLEHAKEKLNLIAENWKEIDYRELKSLDYQVSNLKDQLKKVMDRKAEIKNRLDNFDTEVKKILDI